MKDLMTVLSRCDPHKGDIVEEVLSGDLWIVMNTQLKFSFDDKAHIEMLNLGKKNALIAMRPDTFHKFYKILCKTETPVILWH